MGRLAQELALVPALAGRYTLRMLAAPGRWLSWAAFVALAAWSCAKSPAPAASPGVDGYDDARLQMLVHTGLRHLASGPCRSAMMLGVLDDEDTGRQLDALHEQAARGNVMAACAEVIAVARIVRMGRLGELDLPSELANPSPIARAVALRYALGTQTPAETRQLVELGLADTEVDVRIVAYRVAAALGDPQLVEALSAREPGSDTEKFWRCTALCRLNAEASCGEPAEIRTVVPTADEDPPDRCARAGAEVAGAKRSDALFFYLGTAFRERVEPLDRLEASARVGDTCRLAESVEDTILSSKSEPIEDQAIVAAALLWRRHEPVGVVREKRVDLREVADDDSVSYCSSPQDCPGRSSCFRPTGRGKRGICGGSGAGQAVPRTSVYVTVGSNACWSFMDCPAFYSCYYPDPYAPYGICVY